MDLVKDPAYTGLFASLSVDGADVAGAIQSIQSLDCQFWGWDLAKTPNMLVFNWLACVPLLSGASAFLLSVAQNAANVLQKEAGFFGRWGMAIFLTLFSAYFAALVPAGVGLYWIFGNLFAILVLFLVNAIYPPKKYIDYAALEESKKHLAESKRLQNAGKPTREDKARAKADYKRFVDGTEQKQLVFYSESSGFYKYFHRIIDAILRSSDVKIHYVTSDPKDAVFQLNEPNLIPYYIDNNRLITLFMLVDADIMVMTMPDLQLFHLKRSSVRKDMEYIYLFHGIMTSLSTLRDHALDAYDTLFFGESNMRAEFEAYAKRVSLPEKTLVNVGDGVTEDMHDKVLELRAAEAPHTKRRILIAPSWQADNILESCLGTVVRVLCDGSNEIIIRPHPQYIRRFGARLEEIKEQISAYLSDDCRFEMDFSSNETVYTADILMTDWSGIAFEYAFSTERPVLFIHTPMKVVGENALESDEHRPDILLRNVIGCDLMPETLSETLAPAVERFTTEAASYHDAICAARDQYVYNFGRSGEIGAKYILDRLAAYEAERQRLEAEITV